MSRREALRGALLAAAATAAPWSETAAAQTSRVPQGASGTPAVTGPLSRYISGSQAASVPDDIRELAKRHILDTVASIVACRDLRAATLARAFAKAHSGAGSAGAVTILGTRERAVLIDAVFASAVTGHSAEINDFCPSAFTQPGPSAVSAALCLGSQRRASGESVLKAVIAGYELTCRVPKALGIANLRSLGLANHGVGPVFGTAATAASIMRLPEARIPDLLSYCAQQASGSWQWLLDVEHVEKAFVFAGTPARNGLQAALLVEAGFTGVPNSLDVAGGWLTSVMFTHAGSDSNRAYLIDGALNFDSAQSMERMTTDLAVRNLMSKVEVVDDATLARVPRVESARVTVTLRNGERHESFVEHVDGYPAQPMSHEQVEEKALELMSPKLGVARARQIVSLVWSLDTLPDVRAIVTGMAR